MWRGLNLFGELALFIINLLPDTDARNGATVQRNVENGAGASSDPVDDAANSLMFSHSTIWAISESFPLVEKERRRSAPA